MNVLEIIPQHVSDPTIRPLLSNAHCGLFGISEDYTESPLSLDELIIKNKTATFFFYADGDSMGPLINTGDILIIDCSKKVQSNDIVIADLDGHRLCKRFVQNNSQAYLLSENKKYSPLKLTTEMSFTVFGPVTWIVRKLQ